MTPLPLAVAVCITVAFQPLVLSDREVFDHLHVHTYSADDHPGPKRPARAGLEYLVLVGERCHNGLLAVFEGVEKDRYRLGRDLDLGHEFYVLAEQKCDRNRFLPFAEKYAVADRKKVKISDKAQCSAIDLLGQIGGTKHVELLAPQLDHTDWPIRRHTLKAIAELGDQRHAEVVYDQLSRPRMLVNSPQVRTEKEAIMSAYKALVAKPSPEVEPPPDKKDNKK